MSEYWKRKMQTYFQRLDFDKDGVISKDDWVGMGIRFANFVKADMQKAEHLREEFEKLWEQFMKMAETSGDNNKGLTIEVFIDSIGKQRYSEDLIKAFSGVIRGLFDLMDVNCEGCMHEDDYRRMLAQIGVEDPSFTKEAFRAIDVNHVGRLTYEEFINAYSDFMFSEEEKSPYGHFFGPLVD